MTLLTQIEIEERMYSRGIARAEGAIARAEERGAADTAPYAKEIMRDYVLPLAWAITEDLNQSRPGARAAHVALLKALDPEAVAFLAVRAALNKCMTAGKDVRDGNERAIGYAIGAAIHQELVLAQVAEHNPELYHTIDRDLQRRMSKNERHRVTVMRLQAKKAGIEFVEWPVGAREQVGLWLLGLLRDAGMVAFEDGLRKDEKAALRLVHLSPDLLDRIEQIKAYVAITAPEYGPCVEPPLDWTRPDNGGFHTARMRRLRPCFVACHASIRHKVREANMPVVLSAINAMQRTAWAVNTRILDIVMDMAATGLTDANPNVPGSGEIVSNVRPDKPHKPSWLVPGYGKDAMDEQQTAEFQHWKRAVSEWHTANKLMGVRYGRFYSATRAATFFRDYPELYFVYFADSRGRMYPMTQGISPQGSDLQKALLRFAKGKPLETEASLRWFHIHGANKWGFDKATLSERFMWAHERRELWLHIAADPINHREWTEADSPLQFLAWVLEYAQWVQSPETFVSHLPVSMDGSCNGLQNLSAMLRDEVGGEATNLTKNTTMQDIYRKVADASLLRLKEMVLEDAALDGIRQRWIAHGVARGVVKRAVMTTPYGVTARSATDYVIEDYLKKVENPFSKEEYRHAAAVLMKAVWPAIGDVVVKGRQCMDWLRKSARIIAQTFMPDEDPVIWWTTPSGFIASQAYYEMDVHRINTKLAGCAKIRVLTENDTPAVSEHASGMAPNFVHSMDASHLHLVAAAAGDSGRIDALAMIHDDFGTHAADAELLFSLIRSKFVEMYEEHDPVMSFAMQYPAVPMPPTRGSLDIREVLESDFFFS